MSTRRKRNAVLEALERMRRIDSSVSITHVVSFLYICENEGLNVSELAHMLRMTRATASRVSRALGTPGEAESLAPALGLVVGAPDPNNDRGKLLFLTDQGRTLLAEFDRIIGEAQPIRL